MPDIGRANPAIVRHPVRSASNPLLDLAETLDVLADSIEKQFPSTALQQQQDIGRAEGYRNAAELARKRATTSGPLLERSTTP